MSFLVCCFEREMFGGYWKIIKYLLGRGGGGVDEWRKASARSSSAFKIFVY